MRIAVAGTGYVGLSVAVILAQHHEVVAVDINHDKVDLINQRVSPIVDPEISDYLSNAELSLRATTDGGPAFQEATYVVVATPTDYDPATNYFDTSTVESVTAQVLAANPDAVIVVKSTVPVGFTQRLREDHPGARIVFSPEFLRRVGRFTTTSTRLGSSSATVVRLGADLRTCWSRVPSTRTSPSS